MEIVELLKHGELCLNENNGEFIYKKDILKDIIDTVPKPTETVELLKYRELQLNENNEEFIYRTKIFESVIPSNVI